MNKTVLHAIVLGALFQLSVPCLSQQAVAQDKAAAPVSAGVLYEQGMSAAKAGKYEAAAKPFQDLLKAHPDNALAPRALLELARTYGKLNKTQDGLKLIEQGRETYAKVPGFIDELDALKLHLSAGRGGMSRKKRAQAQQQLKELRQKLNQAKKADNQAEVQKLQGQINKLTKRLNPNAKGMRKKRGGAKSEDIAKLRAEQEQLIQQAHRLEDEGKSEEAYALRRKADAIAAKIEESAGGGRNKGGKNKGNNKNRSRKQLKQIEEQLAGLKEKLAATTDEAEKAKVQERIAGLEKRKSALTAMSRKKKRKGTPDTNGANDKAARKQMRVAKGQFDKARKAYRQAKKNGNETEIAEAKEALDKARKNWDGVRQQAADREKQAQEARITKLRENLEKRGLDNDAIERRVAFARAEQQYAQDYRKKLNDLRKNWKKQGMTRQQMKEAQQKERDAYQQQMKARRKAMELAEKEQAKPANGEQQDSESKPQDSMDGNSMQGDSMQGNSMDGDSMQGDSNDQASRQELKTQRAKRDKKSAKLARGPVSKRLAARANPEMSKRFKKFADKLRKRGVAEAEIHKRIRAHMARFQNGKMRGAGGHKMARKVAQQEQRIQALEAEVRELRAMLQKLMKAQKDSKRVAH